MERDGGWKWLTEIDEAKLEGRNNGEVIKERAADMC